MGYPMKHYCLLKKEKNIPSLGAYIDQAFIRNEFFFFPLCKRFRSNKL